jgi:hypothetical protein
MDRPKNNRTTLQQRSATKAFAFRGDRHRPDLWANLLPNAKAKLVADGLFTTDGKITEKGLKMLRPGQ